MEPLKDLYDPDAPSEVGTDQVGQLAPLHQEFFQKTPVMEKLRGEFGNAFGTQREMQRIVGGAQAESRGLTNREAEQYNRLWGQLPPGPFTEKVKLPGADDRRAGTPLGGVNLSEKGKQALPPTWEEIGPGLAKEYPELDQGRLKEFWGQLRQEGVARRLALAKVGEKPGDYVEHKALPFLSDFLFKVPEQDKYQQALARRQAGQSFPGDVQTIADFERRQKISQEEGQTWGGTLKGAAASVAKIGGEAAVGGPLLKGVTGLAPRAALPWISRGVAAEAGVAVPKLLSSTGAAQAAVGLAARAPLVAATVPSMYVDKWARDNMEAGRDPMDWRGLPKAYGYGVAQAAVFEAIGSAGKGIPGEGAGPWLKRFGAGLGSGVAAAHVADAAAPLFGEKTSYGEFSEAAKGNWGPLGRHLFGQLVTFGAFAGAHAHSAPPLGPEAARYLEWQAKNGVSRDAALKNASQPFDVMSRLLETNPDPSREEVHAAMQALPEGPPREWGEAVARTVPQTTEAATTRNLEQPPDSPPPSQAELELFGKKPADQSGPGKPTSDLDQTTQALGMGPAVKEVAPGPDQPSRAPPPPTEAPKATEAAPGLSLQEMRTRLKAVGSKEWNGSAERVTAEAKRLGLDKFEEKPKEPQVIQPLPREPEGVEVHPAQKAFRDVFPDAKPGVGGIIKGKTATHTVTMEPGSGPDAVKLDFYRNPVPGESFAERQAKMQRVGGKLEPGSLDVARKLTRMVKGIKEAGLKIEYVTDGHQKIYEQALKKLGYRQTAGPVEEGEKPVFRSWEPEAETRHLEAQGPEPGIEPPATPVEPPAETPQQKTARLKENMRRKSQGLRPIEQPAQEPRRAAERPPEEVPLPPELARPASEGPEHAGFADLTPLEEHAYTAWRRGDSLREIREDPELAKLWGRGKQPSHETVRDWLNKAHRKLGGAGTLAGSVEGEKVEPGAAELRAARTKAEDIHDQIDDLAGQIMKETKNGTRELSAEREQFFRSQGERLATALREAQGRREATRRQHQAGRKPVVEAPVRPEAPGELPEVNATAGAQAAEQGAGPPAASHGQPPSPAGGGETAGDKLKELEAKSEHLQNLYLATRREVEAAKKRGDAEGQARNQIGLDHLTKLIDQVQSEMEVAHVQEKDPSLAKQTEGDWVIRLSTFHKPEGAVLSRHASEAEATTVAARERRQWGEEAGYRFAVEHSPGAKPTPEGPERWLSQAREVGIPEEEIHGRAQEIMGDDARHTREHNERVNESMAQDGKDFPKHFKIMRARPDRYLDAAHLPGIDEVADYWSRRYPAWGDPDVLFEVLKQASRGPKKPMTEDQAYSRAFFDANRDKPKSREQPDLFGGRPTDVTSQGDFFPGEGGGKPQGPPPERTDQPDLPGAEREYNDAYKKAVQSAYGPEAVEEAVRGGQEAAHDAVEGRVQPEASQPEGAEGERAEAGAGDFDFGANAGPSPGGEPGQPAARSQSPGGGDVEGAEFYGGIPIPREAGTKIHDFLATSGGEQVKATTRADRESGESLGRLAGVGGYARELSSAMTDRVMPNGTPADRMLAGEVLTELSLRHTQNAYFDLARQKSNQALAAKQAGKTAEAAELFKEANELAKVARGVTSIVGKPGKALQTHQDYQQALQSPMMQEVIQNWRKEMVQGPDGMDQRYRRAQGMDPTDPIDSFTQIPGLPVNLIAKAETPSAGGQAQGRLTNTEIKKYPWANQRKGNAQDYETDLGKMIEQSIFLAERAAAKAEFFRTAEKNGIGEWGFRGERDKGYEIPNVNPPRGTQEKTQAGPPQPGQPAPSTDLQRGERSFYVKDAEVEKDIRKVLQVDRPEDFAGVKKVADYLTRGTLASGVEMASHALNLLSMLKEPAANPFKMMLYGAKILKGELTGKADPTIRDRIVELARINAMKTSPGLESTGNEGALWGGKTDPTWYLGKFLDVWQRSTRLMLEDAWGSLVKQGRKVDTETGKRDFVNQAGNYNLTTQTALVRVLRQTGLGPFAVASNNFAVQGVRSWTGYSPGEAPSWKAEFANRAETVLRAVVLPLSAAAAANYLLNGKILPPGVKIGEIQVGKKDDGTPIVFDALQFLGARRGAQWLPIESAAEGIRQGRTYGEIQDRYVHNLGAKIAQAGEGPLARFGYTAFTGKDLGTGRQLAEKLTEYERRSGKSQTSRDVWAALKTINPAIATLSGADKPNELPRGTLMERLLKRSPGLLGPLAPKESHPPFQK